MSQPYRTDEVEERPAGDANGMLAIVLMLALVVILVLVAFVFVRAV